MRDATCRRARVDASARLDAELDGAAAHALQAHLDACAECRAHERRLAGARAAVRVRPAAPAPDLVDGVAVRIRRDGARRARARSARLRAGLAAAVAAAVVVAGAALPWDERPRDAAAADLVEGVRRAARDLSAYRADLAIVERGWHPRVDERTFSAAVWYEAPERFRLEVDDTTAYPDARWPRADVTVIAAAGRRWTSAPSRCPARALPGCVVASSGSVRTVPAVRHVVALSRRAPFDGSTVVPTDIAVPVETISGAARLDVSGGSTLLGRPTHHVALAYADALPLVAALDPAQSWRPFHPLDRVDLWVDRTTFVPLRFRVVAARAPDRAAWARLHGLRDGPGDVVLEVRATSFTAPDGLPRAAFDAPGAPRESSAGFEPVPFGRVPGALVPRRVAGLRPYRAGRTADGRAVASFADGMSWLRVTRGGRSSVALARATGEEVVLGDGGYAYYLPADATLRRRVALAEGRAGVLLESNLPRAELLRVARSLPGTGEPAPRVSRRPGGFTLTRLDERALGALEWVSLPASLPDGYDAATPSGAYLRSSRAGGAAVTIEYRRAEAEYDGLGIVIEQARPARAVPPSPAASVAVVVRGRPGRWEPDDGQLEWVERGVLHSVRAPSAGLAGALAIARALR
ncbi:MAG TPA: zf-HC2 domain-containing protein [Actinomycetota bacterium]|nr:zf-HC2 domain-containing protein [Actinomycetota bacterium]